MDELLPSTSCFAIDWTARNMYIGNSHLRQIEVVRFDGDNRYRQVVLAYNQVNTSVASPIAMAIDPTQGLSIFFILSFVKSTFLLNIFLFDTSNQFKVLLYIL